MSDPRHGSTGREGRRAIACVLFARTDGRGALLPAGLLRVTMVPVPWPEVAARLRPFIAQRVPPADVDDVV